MNKNQELIDRGWQHMSVLLDREMPQGKRRRRVFAWWLVAAGITLVLSGWGYYALQPVEPVDQHEQQQPTPPVKPEKEIPTASSGSTSSNIQGTALAATETPASDVKQPVNDWHPAVPVSPGLQVNRTTKRSERIEGLSYLSSSYDAQYKPVLSQMHTLQIQTLQPSVEPVFEEQRSISPLVEQTIAQVNPAREMISISPVRTEMPSQLAFGASALTIQPASAKLGRNLGLDAAVAVHMNADGNPLYGIESGLSAVWPKKGRTRVHGGVSYGYYNLDGFSLGVLSLNKSADQELADAFTGGTANNPYDPEQLMVDVQDVYGNTLEFDEAKVLTEKFHYLHVPVSLEYRVAPRLSVSAGVKLGRLLSAPARYGLNNDLFVSTATRSNSRDYLADYHIVSKTDIAPMMSVSYMIAHGLWMDLAYTHGLKHYVNNSSVADRNDFHRTASVALRCNIL